MFIFKCDFPSNQSITSNHARNAVPNPDFLVERKEEKTGQKPLPPTKVQKVTSLSQKKYSLRVIGSV